MTVTLPEVDDLTDALLDEDVPCSVTDCEAAATWAGRIRCPHPHATWLLCDHCHDLITSEHTRLHGLGFVFMCGQHHGRLPVPPVDWRHL